MADDEIIVEGAPEEAKPEPLPTPKDAEDAGLDAREIEMGKKTGALLDEKPKKKEGEGDDDKGGQDDEAKKKEAEAEVKAKADKEKERSREQKPWEKDVPKEEIEAAEKYSPNEKALFWEKKKERYRRQKAEDERDQLKAQVQFYKGKTETLEKIKLEPVKGDDDADDKSEEDDFLNPDGDKGKDKDKPLTQGDLEKIEAEKEAKKKKAQDEFEKTRSEHVKALDEQEKIFKEDHEDYDKVYDEGTKDILEATPEKWAELYPNPVQRRGVQSMVKDMLLALREPTKHTGENSAVALAYEIGKLHPKFSDAADTGGGEDEDGEREDEDSDDKSDLEQRLNGKNRPNSASQNGGGNRKPKSVHDLTEEDLAFMSTDQIRSLKRKHPGVVEKILGRR